MLASVALNLLRFAQTDSDLYEYDYTTTTTLTDEEAMAIGANALLIIGLILLPVMILMIVSMWKIFVKAGRPGWQSLIPVYNGWVLAEIAGKPGWWSLVSLGLVIPFVNIVVGIAVFVLNILISIGLAKNFGKEDSFAILLILVPIVGFPMLAFSKNVQYKAVAASMPVSTPPAAPPTPPATPPTPPATPTV